MAGCRTHLPPALLEEIREVLGHGADLHVVLLDLRLVQDLRAQCFCARRVVAAGAKREAEISGKPADKEEEEP
jgi:hypothetical protein